MKSTQVLGGLFVSSLLLAGCGESAAPSSRANEAVPAVAVTEAWCRPSPNGAQAGACYLTLTASADDRLTGGSTPKAGELQVHEMSTEGGMMKMRHLTEGLPLTAGQAAVLAPGGNHLMLIGLTSPLVAGETAALTLTFAKAPAVTVEAPVRQPAAHGGQHAGH